MRGRYLLAGMMSTALVLGAGGARADDDALRALGLGLSIINNLQQQQQQQQQQQRRQQPVPQQAAPKRQSAAPVRQAPRQQDTAAAQRERAEVEQVQALLNRLGYDAGPVDGAPGPRTRNAIAQFRADYGLSPGKAIDPELVGALRVAGRDAPAVASGAEVRRGAPQAVSPPLWNEPEQGFAAVATDADAPRAATTAAGILMIGDRVAAATNTNFGELGAAFEGYDLVSNLRRIVFSASLSASPGLLDDDAQAVAALEMVGPALAGEIIEEGLGRPLTKSEGYEITNGFIDERFMRGLDPFAEQAVLAAVRADEGRLSVPDAPASPIPLTVFCEVRLMAYDFETVSFPIVSSSCDKEPFGVGRIRTEGPDPVPEGLPMPPEEAEAFLSTKYAKSYLAAFDALLAVDPGAGGQPVLTLSGRTGLRLLAPGSLTEVIYDFGQTDEGGASRPALDGGLYRVDGRIAAVTGSELSSHGPELDVAALAGGIERLAFAYDQALRPEAGLDDEAAIAALRMLPVATGRAIVQASIQRPLSDWQRAQFETGDFSGMLETPFERKRAAEAIRAALKEDAGPLPELPLKLRVYCGVELGTYDFDAGGFPFARSSCDAGVGGLRGVELSGPGPVPALLAMPPGEAEAFAADKSYFFFLASFDADLDFKVKRSELGAVLSNRSGLRLHGHKDPGQITWIAPAESAAAAPVVAAAPAERGPWVLHDEADQAEIVALAGAPKSLPADGAALIAAGGGTLGLLDEPARYLVNEAGSPWPAALFDTYHADDRLRVATALSVPLDYVVELYQSPGGSGVRGLYGLLPAPAASYRAAPPADLYGEPDVRYRWTAAVTGLHAFDLPGGGGITVAVLQPLEGRFTTTDDRDPQVLERFDLTARVPPPDVELIEADSRAAIALAAAGGADRAEFLAELLDSRMNPFDRADLAAEIAGEVIAPDAFWTEGELTLGEYDLKAGVFPVTSGQLGPVEVLRAKDLPSYAIMLQLDGKGLAIPMERQAARAWLEAHAGERPRVRALFGIDKAEATGARNVSVRGKLLEVDFLAPDAVATRRDPEGVLYHVALAEPGAAAPAPQAAPDAAAAVAEAEEVEEVEQAPAVARDVLGIALGAPMPRAVEIVATEIAPTATYSVRRDQMKAGVGDSEVKGWGSFATATLFYNEASRIALGLFSEPPAAADEVTAIVRSQTFVDAGRPHPDAIEGILRDKYGPPAEVRTDLGYARVLLWRGEGEGPHGECVRKLADAARTAGIELHNLARSLVAYPGQFPSVWHDAAGNAWGADDSAIVSARDLFARLGECPELGEVLVALIMSDEDGMVRSLQLALADPAAAGRLVDLNEQAAQESAPTAATGLDVKL